VTAVAVADSWASLPFDHYAKLYVSDLRNDYGVQGGRSFLLDADVDGKVTKAETITANLKQLGTLEPGTLNIVGSYEPTTARNRLLILITIARDGRDTGGPKTSIARYAIQVFLKLGAITIYVFATSLFAAVLLLALPMAQMILMLIVGSGVLGRVLVGNIVSAVKRQASFLHIVAHSEQEAAGFVARIFEDQKSSRGNRTKFQIEIDGHVFVDQVRIKSRSAWPVRLLGVLARPYDLTGSRKGYVPVDRKTMGDEVIEMNTV
jgi:hypothetical protein